MRELSLYNFGKENLAPFGLDTPAPAAAPASAEQPAAPEQPSEPPDEN